MKDDAIKEAQKLYNEALDCQRKQRKQIEEDLRFSDPSNPDQWDAQIKAQREFDPGGARPCLVFDQCGQYVQNVSGGIEKNPPSLHALPVDGGADKKVAEQLDGFFRHIEYASRAQQHYSRATLSAARAGVGYLTVRPEYVNRAMNWQEPRIGSVGDPLSVVFDPWALETDGADASFGYILTPYSHREFERQFGAKAEKISFGDTEQARVDDERESVLVAESWQCVDRLENRIVTIGEDGDETTLSEEDYHAASQRAGMTLPVLANYREKARIVKWCRMSGVAYLSEETTYPADSIGLIPVYGYLGYADGRLTYCGIPRRARNAQRSYNYHMSEMHVFMGQAPKAPWVGPAAAFAGLEALWDRASVDSRAYLPFNHRDMQGEPIPPPQRAPLGVNLQNHAAGAEQALKDIQAALGMYQANLGAPSNETSGVAIDSRKEQGEASTANFPSHLAAAIAQAGKIALEMVVRLIDTKRQIRILGFDGSPGSVEVDPESGQALTETPEGLVINPNIGRYDVRVVVGASYSTQRTQAQAALSEAMRDSPELKPIIAPIWAQNLDIPNSDKLAQALMAMAPEQARAVLAPESGKQPTTADLMAKLDQMQKGLQEAVELAEVTQAELDECEAKLADKSEENEIKRYEAETKRLTVTGANEDQIKAIVGELVNEVLTSPAPLGDEQPEGGELQAKEPIPEDPAMQEFPAQL